MKTLAIAAAVAAIAVVAVVVLVARDAKHDAESRDWPLGLGRIESVPERYPPQETNEAARELERLAAEAGVDFAIEKEPRGRPDNIAEYVHAQLRRPDRRIDPAPPLPAALAAVRTHLLDGPEIVWPRDLSRGMAAPMPNSGAHLRLSRLFVASALERARRGDPAAWEDLRAARTLSSGLWARAELVTAMIAMAIDRNIIVAARKMPTAAPPWFGQLRSFDYRKAMLAAMQFDAWLIGRAIDDERAAEESGLNWLRETYLDVARADFLRNQREAAVELMKVTGCSFDAARFAEKQLATMAWWNLPAKMATPNFFVAWQRLFRFRAELELTEHVLGLRSGTGSGCSDGRWVVAADAVRFSRPIAAAAPAGAGAYPLEFRR